MFGQQFPLRAVARGPPPPLRGPRPYVACGSRSCEFS
jgi:hypothetical protein